MRGKWRKCAIAGAFILFMAVLKMSSVNATDNTVNEQTSGAVVKSYSDITEYRKMGNLKAPNAPENYEGYIFAGWYTDEECKTALDEGITSENITDKAAYAKFVPKEILGVKTQIETSTQYMSDKSDIRFVTTVDSLDYQKVGFKFKIKEQDREIDSNKVYKKLYARNSGGKVIEYEAAEEFYTMSKWFMACTVTNIPNEAFGQGIWITPYWITLDGTKVSGDTIMKTVNMGYMPSMVEGTSNEVGSIDYPSSYANTDEGWKISAQGGCTDGTYYYQAVINRNANDKNGTTGEYNEDSNEVVIQKYSWSAESSKWVLAEDLEKYQSEPLALCHANDITYNSKLGYLVISYCGLYETSKEYIAFMNPETLELINPNTIQDIDLSSFTKTEKYVDINQKITAIDYNAASNRYVVEMSGTHNLLVLNSDFQPVGEEIQEASKMKGYTAQGIGSDDAYIYTLYSGTESYPYNVIGVYDWDGNFKTLIRLDDIPYEIEVESISIYQNKIFISCNSEGYLNTMIYQIGKLQSFTSDMESGTELFALNETAVADIFAETTIKVNEVSSGVSPRVGLHLTNSNGANVDFVVYYNTSQVLQGWVFAVPIDAEGAEGTKQYYAIDSAMEEVSTEGIKLAVAKKDGTLYFYVNDVLQGTKVYDGFGAEDTVTASLYSKSTSSNFTGYSAKAEVTEIEAEMAEAHDTFVADANKDCIYFDILNEDASTPKVTTNETGGFSDSSIINWNGVLTDKFYAETTIDLIKSNDVNSSTGAIYPAQAGIVLTSGENRFFVMLYGNEETGVTYIGYHSMTQDIFDDLSKVENGKDSFWSEKLSLDSTTNKLAVRRNGNQLVVLLNGVVQREIDLSTVKYPITGATTVGLAGWKAKAEFTQYQVKELIESEHALGLDKTASTDIFAETTVTVSDVQNGVSPRVGLRLTNSVGENVDFVISYTNQQVLWDDYMLIVTPGEEGENREWITLSSGAVSAEGTKLAVAKKDGTLYFYLNSKLIATREYKGFGAQDEVTASLYSKQTVSGFSDYSVKTGDIELENVNSDKANSSQVFAFNNTTTTDIYAETTVKISEVDATKSARVGLRLTNESEVNVDFVLYYNGGTLQGWSLVVPVDANGTDAGTKQYYAIDSAMSLVSDAGIKLAVAKKEDTLYFYVNDVLQGTKTYEGFGAEDIVTASLYSKYTTSSFSGYNVKTTVTEIDVKMANAHDTFVADANKSSIYFDILNEEDASTPKVTTNETDTWANSSIVNWNQVPADKFYAETTIELTGRNDSGNVQAGIVLTSGENRYFVMVYGTEAGITYLGYHSMAGDDFDGRKTEWSGVLSLPTKNKLAVYRDGTQMIVLLNDEVQRVIDLAKVNYPITDATTVGLAGWKAKAEFTGYRLMTGDNCPAINVPLSQNDLTSWTVTGSYSVNEESIVLAVGSAEGVEQVLTLNENPSKNICAETVIKVSNVKSGVSPRVGLRLTNQEGKTVDFVLYYNNSGTLQPYPLIVQADETKDYGQTDNTLENAVATEGVKLKVEKNGSTFCFYVNDVLMTDYYDATKTSYTFDGFGEEDTVTVSLYSKYTAGSFSDYSVTTNN